MCFRCKPNLYRFPRKPIRVDLRKRSEYEDYADLYYEYQRAPARAGVLTQIWISFHIPRSIAIGRDNEHEKRQQYDKIVVIVVVDFLHEVAAPPKQRSGKRCYPIISTQHYTKRR